MKYFKFPFRVFSEQFVLKDLLEQSEEFRAYYQGQRQKISRGLYWALDPTLPQGIDYRSSRYLWNGKQIQVIRLRTVPATVEDAFKIAHELEHFVLELDGFPLVSSSPKFENLASALNSMVHDPIVNSRLKKYGFDPRSDYLTEAREDQVQLTSLMRSPDDRIGRLRWMFSYVGKIIDWELVRNSSEKEQKSEFQILFDAKFPIVARRGQKLLRMVKRIGFDTPGKQTKLFEQIIRKYRLKGTLLADRSNVLNDR